jgi:hypothetical protein
MYVLTDYGYYLLGFGIQCFIYINIAQEMDYFGGEVRKIMCLWLHTGRWLAELVAKATGIKI